MGFWGTTVFMGPIVGFNHYKRGKKDKNQVKNYRKRKKEFIFCSKV